MRLETRTRNTLIICVMAGIALGGCAASLTEDELYASQVKRHQEVEQIQKLIGYCEAADRIVVYTGPVTHKLRDPVKRIPNHARPVDYQCVSSRDVEFIRQEF